MWHAFGPCESVTDAIIKYEISTEQGQSGSPIMKVEKGKKFIIGVHIGANYEKTKNLGVRLT